MIKKQIIAGLVILLCIFQCGCAVLTLPIKMVDGTLRAAGGILGGVFKLIKR